MDFNLQLGLSGEARETVTENNTARKYGSGNIDVYATPAMIGLMENAALKCVDPILPEGWSTVGIEINVKHMAATPIGFTVQAKSELIEVDGRRLVFKVEAYDESKKIGEGMHQRFIVQLDKFLSKMRNKS
ncbi:MAG: thioesterase family protein [Bacillota bacterium]